MIVMPGVGTGLIWLPDIPRDEMHKPGVAAHHEHPRFKRAKT